MENNELELKVGDLAISLEISINMVGRHYTIIRIVKDGEGRLYHFEPINGRIKNHIGKVNRPLGIQKNKVVKLNKVKLLELLYAEE